MGLTNLRSDSKGGVNKDAQSANKKTLKNERVLRKRTRFKSSLREEHEMQFLQSRYKHVNAKPTLQPKKEIEKGGRSVREYTKEFYRLGRFGLDIIAKEEDKIEKYVQGLNDALTERVMTAQPKDFKKVVELAPKFEEFQRKRQGKRKAIEEPAKRSRSAPRGDLYTLAHSDQDRCDYYRRMHSGKPYLKRIGACYNCERQGHLAKDCTAPGGKQRGRRQQLKHSPSPKNHHRNPLRCSQKKLRSRQKKMKAFNLSALSESLPDLNSSLSKKQSIMIPRRRNQSRIVDILRVQLGEILQNSYFQSDPLGSIHEHLLNTQPEEQSEHKQKQKKKKKKGTETVTMSSMDTSEK